MFIANKGLFTAGVRLHLHKTTAVTYKTVISVLKLEKIRTTMAKNSFVLALVTISEQIMAGRNVKIVPILLVIVSG